MPKTFHSRVSPKRYEKYYSNAHVESITLTRIEGRVEEVDQPAGIR